MTPDDGVHPHERRDVAESFGRSAARYDRARPRYPAELARRILAGAPGPRVLDVGIGTGISAEPFAGEGGRVLGVEPDEGMAALARSRGFEVESARFEEWEAHGRRFDLVIAGQTWHWIDPVAGARAAARVLAADGRIALFWNIAQPSPELTARFAEVYASVGTGLPFSPWAQPADVSYHAILDAVDAGLHASGRFADPDRWSIPWNADLTRDAWLDQVPTFGGHGLIPPDRLDALLARLGDAIDDVGGTIRIDYTTVVVEATVRPDRGHPAPDAVG